MEITITPDIYTPSVNNTGNYIDNIPIIKNGLFCPCGTRKDKTYENTTKFASHIKSKSHQKWLDTPGKKGQSHNHTDMRKFEDIKGEFLERWDLLK